MDSLRKSCHKTALWVTLLFKEEIIIWCYNFANVYCAFLDYFLMNFTFEQSAHLIRIIEHRRDKIIQMNVKMTFKSNRIISCLNIVISYF